MKICTVDYNVASDHWSVWSENAYSLSGDKIAVTGQGVYQGPSSNTPVQNDSSASSVASNLFMTVLIITVATIYTLLL
jgi:hypothetical protein